MYPRLMLRLQVSRLAVDNVQAPSFPDVMGRDRALRGKQEGRKARTETHDQTYQSPSAKKKHYSMVHSCKCHSERGPSRPEGQQQQRGDMQPRTRHADSDRTRRARLTYRHRTCASMGKRCDSIAGNSSGTAFVLWSTVDTASITWLAAMAASSSSLPA